MKQIYKNLNTGFIIFSSSFPHFLGDFSAIFTSWIHLTGGIQKYWPLLIVNTSTYRQYHEIFTQQFHSPQTHLGRQKY